MSMTDHPILAPLDRPTTVTAMADGGLETSLLFLQGVDLPDFAAFPLLDRPDGRQALRTYYEPYLRLAAARGLRLVLDTPTWRANPDWAARQGYDRTALAQVNRQAVSFIAELAAETAPGLEVTLNGAVGPRGDGYVVGETMSASEAASYHALQVRALAEGGADQVTAVTMTYVEEAVGVTRAAVDAGIAVMVGFTVETDGRLPSGTPLGRAIESVDAVTDGAPAGYMINCAHPSHFESVLNGAWLSRVTAVRANASRMSHEELDEAPDLDRGDPAELASDYRRLQNVLPNLCVVGGCCGTDHEHLDAITGALV